MAGSAFKEIGFTRDLHVCVFANCDGSLPPSDAPKDIQDGAFVTWDDATLGSTTFCADTHHAQLNTTLQPTNKNALTFTVGFYSGVPKKPVGPIKMKVFLREQVFELQADQGLVEMIRRAGLDGLPIQPAPVPARVAGIAGFPIPVWPAGSNKRRRKL